FSQGPAQSPNSEILLYLHPKAGESLAEKTITISQEMKGTAVPTAAKRWKPNPKYAATTKSFASGYAMKLEFGKIADGQLPGKIYIALPDPEKSVVAGVFTASTVMADPAAAAAAGTTPTPESQPAGQSAGDRAAFDKRYGIKR